MKCKCDFRTFMVGDGCDVCNPAKALEYARETIDEQAALIEEMGKALEGLLAIRSDSQGVAGYHLNGEIADWDYFDEVATAEEALAKWKESK